MAETVFVAASSADNSTGTAKLGTARLLFRSAEQMGLTPVWITPLSVFAITIDGQERYINQARSPFNSDASAALAKNKYATRCVLERHAMPNIPFTLPRTLAEAEAFLSQQGTIIAKPVDGSGARDIHIVTAPAQLAQLQIKQYILEKYIAGKELRFLLLNDDVIGVHRSEYGDSVAEDRPLQRISYPQSDWDPALVTLSQRIAHVLNLTFLAVDYLVDATGHVYILEVNTMPGLKWFHAPSSGPVVDVAYLFLKAIVDATRATQQPVHQSVVVGAEPSFSELIGAVL